jgi:hypothetical protein
MRDIFPAKLGRNQETGLYHPNALIGLPISAEKGVMSMIELLFYNQFAIISLRSTTLLVFRAKATGIVIPSKGKNRPWCSVPWSRP